MLSLFPTLLGYEMIAPFILRLTLGGIFILWAYRKVKHRKSSEDTLMACLELVVGVLLVIGLYTQLAAIVSSLILLNRLVYKVKTKTFFTDGVNYYFIVLVISLSLLVTGPGAFAFDLPF